MINLIVAGAGEGTYKSLANVVTSKNPCVDMRIAAVVDVLPQNKLHPQMQELIRNNSIPCLAPNDLATFKFPKQSAAVVMTPNESHFWYADFFAAAGIPVWVEKPPAISLAELDQFMKTSRKYPHLIFSAEYSVDGRCFPILWASNNVSQRDPRLPYIRRQKPGAHKLWKEMGRPMYIDGAVLEGSGSAGTADHRLWLLDGRQGGMIRDLASHLFGILYDIGFATSVITEPQVVLGKHEGGMDRGTWRPLKSADEGETYADMRGRFISRFGVIPFMFRVGKYWPVHERYLKIKFEHGIASFSYEKPFELTMEHENGKANKVWLNTDFYPSIAYLDFKRFMEERGAGHIGRGAAIVRFNETMRAVGIESV